MKDNKKKPVYIKCPRCELNYIQKRQKYCDVCKAELNLIDPAILIPDEEFEEVLCPVCKINLISVDEEMCFLCIKEMAEKQKQVEPDDWSADEVLDEEPIIDDEEEMSIPLSVLEEEEQEEEEDDFDDEGPEIDDFDYVTADELDDMEFDDEEEDDEDFDE